MSSGLPSGRFCFEGFLPAKGKERRARLETISHEPRTTVLYEAPHRLITLLEELQHHCGGDRPLHVARELTKRHEEQVGPTVDRALLHFQQHTPQGECTVVLGGAPTQNVEEPDDDDLLRQLQALQDDGASASDAARQPVSYTHLRAHET